MNRWPVRQYLIFVGLYLLLSLPMFLVLNWEVVNEVREQQVPPDPSLVLAIVLVTLFVLYLVFLADDGVERYVYFLTTPSDWLSILVVLSFLWAAVSWWAVPEIVFYLDPAGESRPLRELVVPILASQIPTLVFLSLLTAIGTAKEEGV